MTVPTQPAEQVHYLVDLLEEMCEGKSYGYYITLMTLVAREVIFSTAEVTGNEPDEVARIFYERLKEINADRMQQIEEDEETLQ